MYYVHISSPSSKSLSHLKRPTHFKFASIKALSSLKVSVFQWHCKSVQTKTVIIKAIAIFSSKIHT